MNEVSVAGAVMVFATADDILEHEGQAVVLVQSQVMLLSHLAAHAVLASRGGVPVQDLCDHLISVFGLPPDGVEPMEYLEMTLATLEEAGVVERRQVA